jgi:DNA-directed RNA polymerase specialized sigma24 family protein
MKAKRFDKIDSTDRCGDMSLDVQGQDGNTMIESLAEKEYDVDSEHPSPEHLLIREAVKALTLQQRRVWDMHNFDRLTQEEIGKKLGISHQGVAKHIKACETRITKWCNANMGAYKLLKHDYEARSW